MVHSLLAAWRVSLHRTRADWPIVAAAALITVLAATLLAAGPIYSSAVSEAGLHRVLESAPIQDANIEVQARVGREEVDAAEARVADALRAALAPTTIEILGGSVSDAFALPGQPGEEVRDLARLGYQDGLQESATLVEGSWPQAAAATAPIELAVLETVARTLDLQVGETLSLVSRIDPDLTVETRVSAIYRPADPAAGIWWNDPTLLAGVVESPNYTTYGPLFTTREDLVNRATPGAVRVTWRAFPNPSEVRIADINTLTTRLQELPARIQAELPAGFTAVATGLPAILTQADRSLLASRTGVLLLLAQLAILAGYAIALTADLIVDHRRLDTALLRSRGASTLQVGVLAIAEAALLAVPAVLVAPWLATLALGLFNVAGPLAAIDLTIQPLVTPDSFLVAAGAALGCTALLVLPAFTAARSYASERSGRARPGTRPLGQRLGLDIALLAVTGIGLWQLRHYGSPLTESVQGTLGMDPLLVAAPAIGILAGSVVALRIVPLLALLADGLTARGRHLVGSLGARQLARRPLRYTRTALLLILAMSMGVFSLSYSSTWLGSQRDQADFAVGADVRVTPARGVDTLPDWAIGVAYGSIHGVSTTLPIVRDRVRITRTAGNAELVATDLAVAPGVVRGRAGPDAAPLGPAAAPLVEARPDVAALALPGVPRRIAINATIAIDAAGTDPFDPETGEPRDDTLDPLELASASSAVPAVAVRDARGLVHRFTGAPSPLTNGGWQFVVPLEPNSAARQATTERLGGALAGPLEIVGLELLVSLPAGTWVSAGRVSVDGLAVSQTIDGGEWQHLDLDSIGAWGARAHQQDGLSAYLDGGSLDGVALEVGSGGSAGGIPELPGANPNGSGVTITFMPGSVVALRDVEVAAVVNSSFIEAAGIDRGDTVMLPLPGGTRRVSIAGVADSFPTTDPSRPLVLLDLESLALTSYAADQQVQGPSEWWLDLDDPEGTNGPAARAIDAAAAGGPLSGATVANRLEVRDRLSSDPIALATIGALSLGFVVAGLFAVIGLAVSAAVSARQRRTEFALLRALGLSPGQLSGWLWLENASLVVVSILAGTGLGLVIASVVLPFITVTQGGAPPVPPVIVDVPWASIGALEAVSIVALVVTLVVLARALRRSGVGSVLRMGED